VPAQVPPGVVVLVKDSSIWLQKLNDPKRFLQLPNFCELAFNLDLLLAGSSLKVYDSKGRYLICVTLGVGGVAQK